MEENTNQDLGEAGKGHRAVPRAESKATPELSAPYTEMVEKWIVGDERRFGPTKEYFIPIPTHHFLDENWYFRLGEKEAVPASRLFDTPQEAALATIKIHDEKIRWATVQKQQLQDWHDHVESEMEAKEKAERDTANAPPKEASCPVCKRRIGLVKGRFARHKWWPRGKPAPCQGSSREAQATSEQKG